MLNLRRVYLVGFALVCVVLLVVSRSGMSSQSILRAYQRGENPTMETCYTLAQKDGLTLSLEEYNMVCSVVQGETGGAKLPWTELVAQVVKNRVTSQEFPNTVEEVLTQPSQFDAIQNYYDGIEVNATTYQAVANVFSGKAYSTAHKLRGATYYCNPDILDEDIASWFDETLTRTYEDYYYVNGHTYHHVFYK